MLTRGLHFLNGITTLKIFGFNSESFDTPLFLPGLLSIWKLDSRNIKAVKRGTGFLKLEFKFESHTLAFLDARNYIGMVGNLDQFGKTFGAGEVKGCYPYEYYDSIEGAQADREWPKYEHFRSSLFRSEINMA